MILVMKSQLNRCWLIFLIFGLITSKDLLHVTLYRMLHSCLWRFVETYSDHLLTIRSFQPLWLQYFLFCPHLFNIETPSFPPLPSPKKKQCCIIIPWTLSCIQVTLNGGRGVLVDDLESGRNRSVILHMNRTFQTWCIN